MVRLLYAYMNMPNALGDWLQPPKDQGKLAWPMGRSMRENKSRNDRKSVKSQMHDKSGNRWTFRFLESLILIKFPTYECSSYDMLSFWMFSMVLPEFNPSHVRKTWCAFLTKYEINALETRSFIEPKSNLITGHVTYFNAYI